MTTVEIRWPHGGDHVLVAGQFNHWKAEPMEKKGSLWVSQFELENGEYQYKFVVDGHWKYDVDHKIVDDRSGNVNNVLVVGEQPNQQHKEQPKPKQEQPKQQNKEQAKEQAKPKDQPKEQAKPKEQPKEQAKPKEQPKEQAKEQAKPKDQPKEQAKPKDQPKEQAKPKQQPKEQSKEQAKPKEQTKEQAKPKQPAKEPAKGKEQPKKDEGKPKAEQKEKVEEKDQPKKDEGKPKAEQKVAKKEEKDAMHFIGHWEKIQVNTVTGKEIWWQFVQSPNDTQAASRIPLRRRYPPDCVSCSEKVLVEDDVFSRYGVEWQPLCLKCYANGANVPLVNVDKEKPSKFKSCYWCHDPEGVVGQSCAKCKEYVERAERDFGITRNEAFTNLYYFNADLRKSRSSTHKH